MNQSSALEFESFDNSSLASSSTSSLSNDLNSKWPSVLFLPSLYPNLYEPSSFINSSNSSIGHDLFILNSNDFQSQNLINRLISFYNSNYYSNELNVNINGGLSYNSLSSSCSSMSSFSSSIIDLNVNDEFMPNIERLCQQQNENNTENRNSSFNYDDDEINQKVNDLISSSSLKDETNLVDVSNLNERNQFKINCDSFSNESLAKNENGYKPSIKTSSPKPKFVAPRFEKKWLENINNQSNNNKSRKHNNNNNDIVEKFSTNKKYLVKNDNDSNSKVINNQISYSNILTNFNNSTNNSNNRTKKQYNNQQEMNQKQPNTLRNKPTTSSNFTYPNNENSYSNQRSPNSNNYKRKTTNYAIKFNNNKNLQKSQYVQQKYCNKCSFNCSCQFNSTSSSSSSLSSSPNTKTSYLNENNIYNQYNHNNQQSVFYNNNTNTNYQYNTSNNKYQSNNSRSRA